MIRQYRIDRYQGLEFLVCEVYFKHTWTQSEYEAFSSWKSDREKFCALNYCTQSNFLNELNAWIDSDHDPLDKFFGLSLPIPAIESIPHLVMRGAIVNNRVASLAVDYLDSVTVLEVIDNIRRFYDFVKSPHWRNTVLSQISNYGSLFGSDND